MTVYHVPHLSYTSDLIKNDTPTVVDDEDDCLQYKNYLDSSRGFGVPVPIFH